MLPSLKLTASSHLKMDGWNTILSYWEQTCYLHETNIAPENQWLEDEFPFGMARFQGLLPLVSGSVAVFLFRKLRGWNDFLRGKVSV